MARPKKDRPSLRKHASGRAIATFNGRDFYFGKHGSKDSKAKYERFLNAYTAHGHIPEHVIQGESEAAAQARAQNERYTCTVEQLVDEFWQMIEREGRYLKNGKPTSERSCYRIAIRPLVRLYGDMRCANFEPKHLKGVRTALCDPLPESEARGRVHEGPRSRQKVNQHVGRIRSIFQWGVEEGLLPGETWFQLKALKPLKKGQTTKAREGNKGKPVDPRLIAAVRRYFLEQQTKAERQAELAGKECNATFWVTADVIRMQHLVGARPEEVVRMNANNIEKRSKKVWLHRVDDHKTAHHDVQRTLVLGRRAIAILEQIEPNDDGFFFIGRYGGVLTRDAYYNRVQKACEALGIDRWTVKDLRHNGLMRARLRGGLDVAQSIGGHTHADMTEHYAEIGIEKAIEHAEQFG